MNRLSQPTGVVIFIGMVVGMMTGIVACSQNEDQKTYNSGVSLHTELGGSAAGYERACGPREFTFPNDHGAHPAFRNEWWYITGNLQSTDGTQFGFHTTFFRIANKLIDNTVSNKASQPVTSDWAADEFYMAHFAITKEGTDSVSAHERFGRSAAALAGAVTDESDTVARIWLDNWQIFAQETDDILQWHVQVNMEGDALDLSFIADKPIILQGNKGYSQKSSDPCNASFYYSMPRMQASGSLVRDHQRYTVDGTAWLDREWSSSALAADQIGWDWFALQLDDGRDIMFYQIRKADGSADPYSHAVEIDKDGTKSVIPIDQINLQIDQWWQSDSGARYPVAGSLQRLDTTETIVFEPLIEDQELDLTVRYWEGAIKLRDAEGRSIGRGYLELTGY